MVMDQSQEFLGKLKETAESDKEQQIAEDNKKINVVVNGAQELFVNGVGTVIFEFPNAELTMEGDMITAQFKTTHLRKSDLLTEAQLKAIYNKPVVIQLEGKDVVIGNGLWTDAEERDLENLPKQLDESTENFRNYRQEYQELEVQLLALEDNEANKEKRATLEGQRNKIFAETERIYLETVELRKQIIDLQTKRIQLFASSLEEMSFLEKIKLYAPSCIKIKKEDGSVDFLWKSPKDFLTDNTVAVKLIGLYNLFLRGIDVSFFGDRPEGGTS